jgi:hypothetical protein
MERLDYQDRIQANTTLIQWMVVEIIRPKATEVINICHDLWGLLGIKRFRRFRRIGHLVLGCVQAGVSSLVTRHSEPASSL